MSYPQTCQCKEDWTDGTGICQECHLKRINTQADLHAVVDFIRETEKLEAQVAEWMGVANQQILRIQELEKERDSAQALLKDAVGALATVNRLIQTEINPLNYDHDDVMALNSEATEAVMLARDFLSRDEVQAIGGGK